MKMKLTKEILKQVCFDLILIIIFLCFIFHCAYQIKLLVSLSIIDYIVIHILAIISIFFSKILVGLK